MSFPNEGAERDISDTIIRDRRLTAADIASLAADGAACHLVACDLDEVRIAERDLSGWTFERVTIQNADFRGQSWSARVGGPAAAASRTLPDPI